MVQHPIVDPPEEKMLVDYENQPGLRIPMSLGRIKEDHDKRTPSNYSQKEAFAKLSTQS